MDAWTDITARDWQQAMGRPGEVVTGLDDVAQCLRVILTTARGSDPLRPEFGSDIWRYVDHPIDQAIPHIVREVWDAVTLWEPRVTLERVTVRAGEQPGHVVLRVQWRLTGADSGTAMEVTL